MASKDGKLESEKDKHENWRMAVCVCMWETWDKLRNSTV